jgi:hypothetical protein
MNSADKRGIMSIKKALSLGVTLLALIGFGLMLVSGGSARDDSEIEAQANSRKLKGFDAEINGNVEQMIKNGRETFRNDTFGDEAFWGDSLQLHKAIAGGGLGGVGAGVSPKTALSVGLKVDSGCAA